MPLMIAKVSGSSSADRVSLDGRPQPRRGLFVRAALTVGLSGLVLLAACQSFLNYLSLEAAFKPPPANKVALQGTLRLWADTRGLWYALTPDDSQANNLIGMYWLYQNNASKAREQFEYSIKRDASNPAAWYYLAVIARSQGDNQTALNNLMSAIRIAPTFRQAYELSAQIYESVGEPERAQQFRAALARIK